MVPQSLPVQSGPGVEKQQPINNLQQQLGGDKGLVLTDCSKDIGNKGGQSTSHVLQGSSSASGATVVQAENSEIAKANVDMDVQWTTTTKMCKRCGIKGHLMFDYTVVVFCEICKSTDHAMSQCSVLKQPKPVAQLVGQAADALASFYIPHAPIQPTKKDSRLALV